MAIRSEVVGNQKEEAFPKLMASTKTSVVIMATTREGEHLVGSVVRDDARENYGIGYHATTWLYGCFTDFPGTIQLSNE